MDWRDAEWILRGGVALDWPRYSRGNYAAVQNEARRAERGLWTGGFVAPWRYRACRTSGGSQMACSDLQNDTAF
jgi:endonuclease YncB( thermonuclease family)